MTLESMSYSCTSSESSETSKEVASCWSCGWMSEALVSTSSGKGWVGETARFLCWCIWGTVHILRGSVPALHLTWPWYIKFLESWRWIFREKLANYRPCSRISRNKLVFFTNHGITFVHGSREINSFVHDSRQLIIGIHGSRKTPFLTFMVACESIRFSFALRRWGRFGKRPQRRRAKEKRMPSQANPHGGL